MEDNISWIKNKFLSRKIKVLHIGNIANNAYNNAKLLAEVGFSCDVICYDYYHVMGCPEWEDADFENTLADDFAPDWQDLDLNGFKRPKWFVQGPLNLCLAYLCEKNSGNLRNASHLWRALGLYNRTQSANSFRVNLSLNFLLPRIRYSRIVVLLYQFATFEQDQLTAALMKRIQSLLGEDSARSIVRIIVISRDAVLSLLMQFRYIYHRISRFDSVKGKQFSSDKIRPPGYEHLIKKWINNFPAGFNRPTRKDLMAFRNIEEWTRLLSYYDIVIGYSTDPVFPMLVNVPYFAFEHGTLRHIPYKNDVQGRLAAAAYHEADHVFVTNFDCVATAERLVGKRYTFINHPFDDQHGQNVKGGLEQRKLLQLKLDADFLFFFPTRQDWVEGTGYADKANDIFIRAIAKLRASGYRVGVVCCNWGGNVEESKNLISELRLDRYVEWVPTLPIIPFERMCKAVDIVADQFKLGAFGGVVFKAMAVGAPILSYLNEDLLRAQYSVLPPVINCSTVDDIFDQMQWLIRNPNALREIGRQSKQWITDHHAKGDTLDLQISQFRKLLEDPVNYKQNQR